MKNLLNGTIAGLTLLILFSGCKDPESSNAQNSSVSNSERAADKLSDSKSEELAPVEENGNQEPQIGKRKLNPAELALEADIREYEEKWKPFCDKIADKILHIEDELVRTSPTEGCGFDYNGTLELMVVSQQLSRLIQSEVDYFCWMPDVYDGSIGRYTDANIFSRYLVDLRVVEARELRLGISPAVRESRRWADSVVTSQYSQWVAEEHRTFYGRTLPYHKVDYDRVIRNYDHY